MVHVVRRVTLAKIAKIVQIFACAPETGYFFVTSVMEQ